MAQNRDTALKPADVVADLYLVESLAGRGGFAEVYSVRGPDGRRRALKILLATHAENAVSRDRMVREIVVLKRLEHPNIVRFVDCGVANDSDVFIVMEFIEGHTLRDVMARGASLAIDRALRIAIQICGALEAAHKRAFIHRDIKPENIFLLANDFVKVADWGLARVEKVSGGTTRAIGTAAYMPPDQAMHIPGSDADFRWDQCALGYVLWEMITGYGPRRGPAAYQFWEDFAGRAVDTQAGIPQAIMYKIVMEMDIPTLEQENGCPRMVSEAVARAVARDPNKRFASIGAFREALEHCLDTLKEAWDPLDGQLGGAEERLTVALDRVARAAAPSLARSPVDALAVDEESSPALVVRAPAEERGPRGTIRMQKTPAVVASVATKRMVDAAVTTTAPFSPADVPHHPAFALRSSEPRLDSQEVAGGTLPADAAPAEPIAWWTWGAWFGFDRIDKRIALINFPIVLVVGALALGLPARFAARWARAHEPVAPAAPALGPDPVVPTAGEPAAAPTTSVLEPSPESSPEHAEAPSAAASTAPSALPSGAVAPGRPAPTSSPPAAPPTVAPRPKPSTPRFPAPPTGPSPPPPPQTPQFPDMP